MIVHECSSRRLQHCHLVSIRTMHTHSCTCVHYCCVLLLKQVGFISIVWNDACDPKVFQLDVTLADDKNSARNRITTVPCSGDTAGVPTCMWMAAVKTEARDEYEGNGMRYVQPLAVLMILFLQ
jgi:hypothetical protein